MIRPRDIVPYVLVLALSLSLVLLEVSKHLQWPESQLSALSVIPVGMAIEENLSQTQNQDQEQVDLLRVESDQPVECSVSLRYPESVTRWCALIDKYAQKHSLEPDLVAALIWLESGGSPNAYSSSGAVGLMQVMPKDGLAEKFICPNGPCFKDRPTIAKLKDPEFNIFYGTRMLANLLERHGNLREALKAYGPMDVGYSYAEKVLALYKRFGN